MCLPFSEGFVGFHLKMRLSSLVVTKKTYQNENPRKILRSIQAHEAEGSEDLLNLPSGKTVRKNKALDNS